MKQMEQKAGNWCFWVKGVDRSSWYHSCKFSACLKGHQNKKLPQKTRSHIKYKGSSQPPEDPAQVTTVTCVTHTYTQRLEGKSLYNVDPGDRKVRRV